jgi:type IV secretory pathway TrbL component
MNNVVKNGFYAIAWLILVGLNTANAGITFDSSNTVDAGLKWNDATADKVIEGWLSYLVWFLYLIAIIMIVYGGFNILTAGWDEEKVKKGKTILMQAVGWLVVVFIANSIISWLITWLFGSAVGA